MAKLENMVYSGYYLFLVLLVLSVIVKSTSSQDSMMDYRPKSRVLHTWLQRVPSVEIITPTTNNNQSSIKRKKCMNMNASPPAEFQRIPYHTHIHKSGGSTVCSLALYSSPELFSNLATTRLRNCNLEGDGPQTIASGIHHLYANKNVCCADRYQVAREKQRGLISRELYLDDFFCPQWFVYSVILREPISRIQSHFNFQKHKWSDVEIWINQTTFTLSWDVNKLLDRNSWSILSGTAPYHNYHIRIFGGYQSYYTSIPEINSQHLEMAKNKIDQYQIVIQIEKLEEQLIQFNHFFGWKLIELSFSESKRHIPNQYNAKLDLKSIEMIRQVNQLDSKFYNYAVEIASNLTKKCQVL